jgi:hypothetical protein
MSVSITGNIIIDKPLVDVYNYVSSFDVINRHYPFVKTNKPKIKVGNHFIEQIPLLLILPLLYITLDWKITNVNAPNYVRMHMTKVKGFMYTLFLGIFNLNFVVEYIGYTVGKSTLYIRKITITSESNVFLRFVFKYFVGKILQIILYIETYTYLYYTKSDLGS